MTTPSSPHNRREFLKKAGAASAGLLLAGSVSPLLAEPDPAAAAPGESLVPKRKFGRHEEMVSSLALGGHTLATASSQEESTRIAHAAIDRGVTFFDNAWDYHNGRAEECMGAALKGGYRDKVFLMTKVCTHGRGKDVAMKMLEDSLTRLGTNHLDLWQIHSLTKESEIDSAFAPGGVIEALEEAKKQGKIRYVGFTGHRDPRIHAKMLSHKYPFDSVQMPLSAFDATDDGFQKIVLPELIKQGIAPLAMKTLTGNARPLRDGVITAEESIRYALSLPIAVVISGINSMEHLEQNARVAANFKPFAREEMIALETRCGAHKNYQGYRAFAYRDGDSHMGQVSVA